MTAFQSIGEFSRLLNEARSGSDAAATRLVQMYGPHVVRAVRRNLSRELRNKFDSGDFAQAVWASFFTAFQAIPALDQPGQLISLLSSMARNKVVDETRRRLDTLKYDVQRERPLQSVGEGDEAVATSRDPTPSQIAIARERWVRMLRDQPVQHQQIIRQRLMGRTNPSIAANLGISERTVRRVIERLMRGME